MLEIDKKQIGAIPALIPRERLDELPPDLRKRIMELRGLAKELLVNRVSPEGIATLRNTLTLAGYLLKPKAPQKQGKSGTSQP